MGMEYKVIRSDRRTLSLEIGAEGAPLVRAPRRCPEREIERFVESHTEWILRHQERWWRRQAAQAARQVTPQQEETLRRQAAQVIPGRVEVFAARMGVIPAGVKITSARKRFGSCSGKNGLCFSWRLMQYPPEAVDYVVVHELAHIRHHDHSAAFWAFVAETMPDYRARQALLRD